MKIYDISWPITPTMTSYKNEYPITITQLKDFDTHGVRLSSINLSNHTGTHIDAPSHFLKNGATVEMINPTSLCGDAVVIDCTECDQKIMLNDLAMHESKIVENSFILFKTKNSLLSPNAAFQNDFVYLDASSVPYLITKKIKGIGFDYLGIERNQVNHQSHVLLMENNITIVEGLRLSTIDQGNYSFIMAPLLIEGADGAPGRAFLIKN